jgi:hypothetical protein
MQLGPLLTAHSFMRIERPPLLWDADTEDLRFLPLLGEMIAAALGKGTPLAELTLNAANVVVEPSPDAGGEPAAPPLPGEYVAVTVSGVADFGPDAAWTRAERKRTNGLLERLSSSLETAGARFAYVRRIGDHGSFTVFLDRLRDAR